MGSVSGLGRAGVFPEDGVPEPAEPILDLPGAPDKVQELLWGSWPEERLGTPRAVSLRVFPFFLNRVTRSIRKTCSRRGTSEYPLRREETRIVWVSIRPCPEKVILWGEGKSLVVKAGDPAFEGLAIVLDREDIIASLLPDPKGQGILGMEGVGGTPLPERSRGSRGGRPGSRGPWDRPGVSGRQRIPRARASCSGPSEIGRRPMPPPCGRASRSGPPPG